jgi:hypothetical protein
VIGGEPRREQGLEEVFDLTQADPGGEGDDGDLSELGRVAEDRPVGSSALRGELVAEPLILGVESVEFGPTVVGVEPPFDPARVLVERLSAAAGLLGPASDGAVGPREDGGGVADEVAER